MPLELFSKKIFDNYSYLNGSSDKKESLENYFLSGFNELIVPSTLVEWESRRNRIVDSLKQFYKLDQWLSAQYPLNAIYHDTLDRPLYSIVLLTFQSYDGVRVPATLYLPKNGLEKKPAVVYAEGYYFDAYGYNFANVDHWQRMSQHLALRGYVVLSINQLGLGQSALAGDTYQYQGYKFNFAGDAFKVRSRLAPFIQGINYLFSREDVDTTFIGITGYSAAGAIAVEVGAIDQRIACTIVNDGGIYKTKLINESERIDPRSTTFSGSEASIDDFVLFSLFPPRPMIFIDSNQELYENYIPAALDRFKKLYEMYNTASGFHFLTNVGNHNYNNEKRLIAYSYFDTILGLPAGLNEHDPSIELFDTLFHPSSFLISDFETKNTDEILSEMIYANSLKSVSDLEDYDISEAYSKLGVDTSWSVISVSVKDSLSSGPYTVLYETIVLKEPLRDGSKLEYPVVTLKRNDKRPKNKVFFVAENEIGREVWKTDSSLSRQLTNLLDSGFIVTGIDLLGYGELDIQFPSTNSLNGSGYYKEQWTTEWVGYSGQLLMGHRISSLIAILKYLEDSRADILSVLWGYGFSPSLVVQFVANKYPKTGTTILSNYLFDWNQLLNTTYGYYPDLYEANLLKTIDPSAIIAKSRVPLLIQDIMNETRVKVTEGYRSRFESIRGSYFFGPELARSELLNTQLNFDYDISDTLRFWLNNKPQIISNYFFNAAEDAYFHSNILVNDPDTLLYESELRYRFDNLPQWLILDSVRGFFYGTPTANDIGSYVIKLQVTDVAGDYDSASITLNVVHTNHPPLWRSEFKTDAKEGLIYDAYVYASDKDSALFGDTVKYEILGGPKWMEIDSLTGKMSGMPPNNTHGDLPLNLRAKDQFGGFKDTMIVIHIEPTNYPPPVPIAVFPAMGDTITIFRKPLVYRFIWRASIDPDNEDTVNYLLHFTGNNLDTMIKVKSDTSLDFDSAVLNEMSEYSLKLYAVDDEFSSMSDSSVTFFTTQAYANRNYVDVPTDYKLHQNYPNPFGHMTNICFQIPELSNVTITFYNTIGQFVDRIVLEKVEPKYYEVKWFATAKSSAVYFVRFEASSFVSRKKFQKVMKILHVK